MQMIYLKPNQSNSVRTTLWENSTNFVDPYFTWKVVNKQSLAQTVFYADDWSNVPWYWNGFTISCTNSISPGLTQGQINIQPGEYTYTVYQMAAPYDLNLNNAIKEVETGILILEGTGGAPLSYTASSGNVNVWTNMNRI